MNSKEKFIKELDELLKAKGYMDATVDAYTRSHPTGRIFCRYYELKEKSSRLCREYQDLYDAFVKYWGESISLDTNKKAT